MTNPLRSLSSVSRIGAAAAVFTGALVALSLAPTAAQAQTTLFQTGFEASEGYSTTAITQINLPSTTGGPVNFASAPGALYGQSSQFKDFVTSTLTPPNEAAVAYPKIVNGTTVVNNLVALGSQSVKMTGSTLSNYYALWAPVNSIVADAGGTLRMAADMNVTNPSASYGQWGLSFLSPSTALAGNEVGSAGAIGAIAGNLIASNDGVHLFAAVNLTTGKAYSASNANFAAYNTFNNYALQLNFDSRNISGFLNGVQVGFVPLDAAFNPIGPAVLNMPFVASATNYIRYATFGDFTPNTLENAYIDNVKVSGSNVRVGSAAAPEPGTLALMGFGLVGLGGLRRRIRYGK